MAQTLRAAETAHLAWILVAGLVDAPDEARYTSTKVEIFWIRDSEPMDTTRRDQLVLWLKALAEPNRLLLLDLIIRGYQCNCQLGEESGLPANLVSHHLGVLREVGLLSTERDPYDGRWVYYSVNTEALIRLNAAFGRFSSPDRIQPRRLTCGPQVKAAAQLGSISDPLGGAL